jgi:hypothetical protein
MDAFDSNVPDYFHGCWGSNPDAYCPQSNGIQAGGAGAVCDFTITPANFVANNCTGTSQNSNIWVSG